ncbi:hypothetical protein Tco_0005040 [Tanacetum coccineum]
MHYHEAKLFLYYIAFLTAVEPKSSTRMVRQLSSVPDIDLNFSKGSVDHTLFIPGIFINHLKYALESLKKYGFDSCDLVDTPMVEKSKLDKDKEGKAIDPSHYRGMIGTLLYLIANRPDL